MSPIFRKKQPEKTARETKTQQSSSVFSYYSSRDRSSDAVGRGRKTQQDSGKSKRIRRWAQKFPATGLVIIIVISVLYLTSLSTSVRIVPFVDSTPNLLRKSEIYADFTNDLLAGSLLNYSKLTLNSDKVADSIKERFPELENVSVIIPISGRRPVVHVQPGTPSLLLAVENRVFILDRSGQVLIDAREAPAGITKDLMLVRDESSLEVMPGSPALTRDSVAFILVVLGQLEAASIAVESLNLPAAPYELNVRAKGEGYYTKFHMLGDARIQSGALLAVRDKLKADNETPKEYIDVRLEDKVYYK